MCINYSLAYLKYLNKYAIATNVTANIKFGSHRLIIHVLWEFYFVLASLPMILWLCNFFKVFTNKLGVLNAVPLFGTLFQINSAMCYLSLLFYKKFIIQHVLQCCNKNCSPVFFRKFTPKHHSCRH